ncbi:MAG: hypothetical protein WBY53_02160 [Acidobacteriaceae bacterium]
MEPVEPRTAIFFTYFILLLLAVIEGGGWQGIGVEGIGEKGGLIGGPPAKAKYRDLSAPSAQNADSGRDDELFALGEISLLSFSPIPYPLSPILYPLSSIPYPLPSKKGATL